MRLIPFSAASNQLPQLDAVIIRNLTYEIGRGKHKKTILDKINLTVPEGSIYGLLGPSGCGKTTMLKCVVGRLWQRSGSVLVFGQRPGGGQGEVPGRDVGYMPQEISIYEDFTIEETLQYFGKINRMPNGDIRKRIEFLVNFLDLPSKRRLVVNLSGGQKRRVSLAAALVHSPPLLILDEPTVGVDPLLRQNIWRHLVTLTKTERISVIITTHYIEEARLANVVGLMRHGKILAENSPDELMHRHQLTNLEEVFLKLCMSDSSSRRAAGGSHRNRSNELRQRRKQAAQMSNDDPATASGNGATSANIGAISDTPIDYAHRWNAIDKHNQRTTTTTSVLIEATNNLSQRNTQLLGSNSSTRPGPIKIHFGGGGERHSQQVDSSRVRGAHINEAVEFFSSEDEEDDEKDDDGRVRTSRRDTSEHSHHQNLHVATATGGGRLAERHGVSMAGAAPRPQGGGRDIVKPHEELDANDLTLSSTVSSSAYLEEQEDYVAMQAMHWAARRNNALNFMRIGLHRDPYDGLDGRKRPSGKSGGGGSHHHHRHSMLPSGGKGASNYARWTNAGGHHQGGHLYQWWRILMAVTWKNYIRLRRNPPVLVFQFMLPAIQVILFCLCIGGEPFDVPVAIVNEELVPKSSVQFLNGLNRKIIRQIKYDNLTSAIEAVRRGKVWGAIHIPDKYSENLQSRLIMGEEVTNETISNGTIRVYPDLTNLHLALTLETTFRETFINFARDSLEELGYDRSLADMPIQVGKPVYGTTKQGGYLEFMAPGVVISISYVMATGLTALAFILERRDGLLERSLVSGVQTSQILLAHAINQVFVMTIQIFLVLGCTFFIFEIPSRGPFFWVVLLILLQGCTGMGFGLLVSAICTEENTAVMMVVGTFYTNLILAGIIWPIEAMPHWLRPLSYAQPQTLPTETLRHILSRGWGILEPDVLLGFAVTIGWLFVFLVTAGIIFKYSR